MSFFLVEMIFLAILIDASLVLLGFSIYDQLKNKRFKLSEKGTWVKISVGLLILLNAYIFYTLF